MSKRIQAVKVKSGTKPIVAPLDQRSPAGRPMAN